MPCVGEFLSIPTTILNLLQSTNLKKIVVATIICGHNTVLVKTHLNLYFVPLDNSAVSVCVTGKCPILFLLMTMNYKGQ